MEHINNADLASTTFDFVSVHEVAIENTEDSEYTEIYDLLQTWELSWEAIQMVLACRVNTLQRLKMLNSEDICEIFNSRNFIGEKITFRYHLQKWREKNNYEPLFPTASDRTLSNSYRIHEWMNSPSTPGSEINLEGILQKTVDGKDIIAKYRASNSLNDRDQTSIVRIIVDHYILNGIKMDAKTMESVAAAISKLLPTESETTYYIPRTKTKNASGKLYDRYYNQRNKRKHFDSPTPKLYRVSKETKGDETSEVLMDAAEFEAKKKWLVHNIPQNITNIWKATSVLRMRENKKSLTDFLNDWPRYKDHNGYKLLDVDFETIHPGKQNLMFEKIQDLQKVMVEEIFPKYVNDKLNMQYIEKMKAATDINTKHLYFFFCCIPS